MKSEYFTVLEKNTEGQTVRRVGSFTTEEAAKELADYKNDRHTRVFFDVVRSDLYETFDEFRDDERKILLASAKAKLTADEWEAVQAIG